jgi:hypothetical protein
VELCLGFGEPLISSALQPCTPQGCSRLAIGTGTIDLLAYRVLDLSGECSLCSLYLRLVPVGCELHASARSAGYILHELVRGLCIARSDHPRRN